MTETLRRYWWLMMILLTVFIFMVSEKFIALFSDPGLIFKKVLDISGIGKLTVSALTFQFLFLLVAMMIELFSAGYKQSVIYKLINNRTKSLRTDILSWLLVTFGLFDLLWLISTFGVFYILSGYFTQFIHVKWDYHWTMFIFAFLLSDLKNYIWHRALHSKYFWKLHAFHHSATELTLFTTMRTHFWQKNISVFLDAFLFSFFAFPVEQFFMINAGYQILQYLHHSSVTFDFGWVGRWVIFSPAHHRLHHSLKPQYFGKNLGSSLVIWDRFFGTYCDPDPHVDTFGVPENRYNRKSYMHDVIMTIKNFLGFRSESKT
jgi:sterol desaturase/sphingolipid hydroxylase (fatty acid hydroxylase superfamily)